MDDISNAVADDLASLEKKSAELGEQMGAMMEGQLKELAAAQFASDEALAEQTAKMARVEHVIQTQLSDGLGDLAGSLEVRSNLSTTHIHLVWNSSKESEQVEFKAWHLLTFVAILFRR